MLLIQVKDCKGGVGEITGSNDEVYALFEEYARMLFEDIPIPINIKSSTPGAHITTVTVLWVLREESPSGQTVMSVKRSCECVFKLIEDAEQNHSDIVVPQKQLIVPK